MRNILLRALVALFILQVAPHRAQAEDAKAIHPDWTGYYRLATPKQLAGTGFKQDAPGEQLNALITPHLQPWAKARMEATDGVAEDTGQVCLPDGIFRYPSMGGIFLLLQERGKLLLVYSNINTAGVERIYLDRPHPKNPTPTYNGDSVGRWEGYMLVVDTIGFNDKTWLFGGMQPHTEEVHLIQRVRGVGNDLLEMTHIVEDRHALTSAYTFKRYFKKNPSDEMPEDVCNEDADTWKGFRNARLKKHLDEAKHIK